MDLYPQTETAANLLQSFKGFPSPKVPRSIMNVERRSSSVYSDEKSDHFDLEHFLWPSKAANMELVQPSFYNSESPTLAEPTLNLQKEQARLAHELEKKMATWQALRKIVDHSAQCGKSIIAACGRANKQILSEEQQWLDNCNLI